MVDEEDKENSVVDNVIFCFVAVCSVFWDLYCAAPERRDTCDHSSEAKAFHDYVSPSTPSIKTL